MPQGFASGKATLGLAVAVAAGAFGCGGGSAGAGGGGGSTTATTTVNAASVVTTVGSGGATSSTTGHGGTSASTTTSTSAGGGSDFVPTPADIDFVAGDPLPKGEQILFNDWNASPNSVSAVTTDGKTTTTLFTASRVWSMGADPSGGKIAFSCCGNDTIQKHYGLPSSVGDAIQQSWIFDSASQSVSVVAYGNINDECYVFGPLGTTLYLCRRYDFSLDSQMNLSNKGYRVGMLDLSSLAFSFLTPDSSSEIDLDGTPNHDESSILYTAILISGATQSRQINRASLPSGASPAVVRTNADSPVFSPDGSRYAYTDYGKQGALFTAKADGSGPIEVSSEKGDTAVWSPDGTKIAYLLYDETANCSSIQVVASDGSQANQPKRLRDCSSTGESITNLAWITH